MDSRSAGARRPDGKDGDKMRRFIAAFAALLMLVGMAGAAQAQPRNNASVHLSLRRAIRYKYSVITPNSSGDAAGHLGASHQNGNDIIPPFWWNDPNDDRTEASSSTPSTGMLRARRSGRNDCVVPEEPTETATATETPTETATADRDPDGNGYRHGDADRDRHGDRDADGNGHGDRDADGNGHADRDRHGNDHGDHDRHGDCDRHGDQDRDGRRAANTGTGDGGSAGGGMIASLLAAAGIMLAAGAYLTRRMQRA